MLPAKINSQSVFEITIYGVAAAPLFQMRGQGSVVAVFDNSFYIDMGGRLVCIVDDDLPASPLNICISWPRSLSWLACGLKCGDRVSVAGRSILVGQSFQFNGSHAQIWRPPASPKDWNQNTLCRGLIALMKAFQLQAPARSFARFMLQRSEQQPLNNFYTEFREQLKAIRGTTITISHVPAAANRLQELVGLGEGLTPSGDDFIGGILIALVGAGHQESADYIYSTIMPVARQRTNSISVAHLDCASQGLTSLPLHHLLNAVLCGRSIEVGQSAKDINQIGHTSGWDIAAGMLFALEGIAKQSDSAFSCESRSQKTRPTTFRS